MSLKVGAHVSISSSRASNDPETPPYGNIANAVFRQTQFGGNCGQIFTHSPQVWQDPDIGDEEAEQFREGTERDMEGPWVIHTSYLVNLCTPKEGLREKSLDSMQKEVDAADKLGIPYVNVHLGAHTGAGVEGGLDNAASVIDDLDVPDGVTILIESDAGAGTKLGGEFEHLAGVIDRTETEIDVCVDTAHAFAAGYDLSTPEAVDQTVAEFDDVVGLEHLEYVHLNDSKHACGTHKDEHAHIGEGLIGEDGMERFLNHPDLADVPLALETPTEDGKSFAWNIDRVRELRAE
ncbi:endonuclease IV [Halorubrum saccharovorum]|uniref:Probable endonuclease 4 n=1 Tax=Halorubrum saccharovorum TaxID=2248 RepID=A0A081EXQ8_9EURY|nr:MULTISPECIES: deoxyribonuclease IV [Halorubrum]KDS92196.1 endonuclease IV [Halorubrum saccharovorum]